MLRFSQCNDDFNSKKLEGTLISIKRGLENKSWYIHTVGGIQCNYCKERNMFIYTCVQKCPQCTVELR